MANPFATIPNQNINIIDIIDNMDMYDEIEYRKPIRYTDRVFFNPIFNINNTIKEIQIINDYEYKNNYITFTNLKEDRNWSNSLITKFLPTPDLLTNNPHNNKQKCKLYLISKVIEIENTNEFEKQYTKIAKRRNIATFIADKKREELLNYVNNIQITIKHFKNKNKLYKAARGHYNNLQQKKRKRNIIHKDVDEAFMKRISVNFLRHTSDEYEVELDKLVGKVGRFQAYNLLKQRVNEMIYDKYPFLLYSDDEIMNYLY